MLDHREDTKPANFLAADEQLGPNASRDTAPQGACGRAQAPLQQAGNVLLHVHRGSGHWQAHVLRMVKPRQSTAEDRVRPDKTP